VSDRFEQLSREWFEESVRARYSYRWSWMGRPVIQYPQDMLAMQEIIWAVKPDLIVETGIAHGGSLVYYASLQRAFGIDGLVVGVDVEIRPHNRAALEAHPMIGGIRLIEGSSVDPAIVAQVRDLARGRERVLVTLDSNHTHAHVRQELDLYSPLVTAGSYLVVFDTAVEDLPKSFFPDRPWGPGDNPKTAVREFLRGDPRFEVDRELEARLAVSVAPEGYLRCVGP
jgi:cephalosporin hydroxylase